MIVYRLCKSIYASDLSGQGAEKFGGRWNSKGTSVIYSSSSRALCTVEIAVHTALGNVPKDYVLVSLEIPDEIEIDTLAEDQLPANWKKFPHSLSTQIIGDARLETLKTSMIRVPSAVVQGDYNYLINPKHIQMKEVKIKSIEEYEFDERLFNLSSR